MKRVISRILTALAVIAMAAMVPGQAEGSEMSYRPYLLIEASMPGQVVDPYREPDAASGMTEQQRSEAFDGWFRAQQLRQMAQIPDRAAFDAFVKSALRQWLISGTEENALCSPYDLWRCLHMLACLTRGESRAQVMRLLGIDTEEMLSRQAAGLWQAQYWDDGASVVRPAASLWLNRACEISDEGAALISEECHASVFQGDMAEESYIAALRAWLDRQTNALISDTVSDLSFDPAAVLSICSTLYFRAPWSSPFDGERTSPEIFHAPSGDIEAPFMRKDAMTDYYRGEGFSAVLLDLQGDSRLALVLPEEGVSPRALLEGDQLFAFLFQGDAWEERAFLEVHLRMPKLDVTGGLSLREGLEQLGVVDVFDAEKADLSGSVLSDRPVSVSELYQFTRLIADEEGIEAASVTVSDVFGMLLAEDEVNFTLDRPFLFALLGPGNVPLFAGVLNEP